jgi:hypothetical protein
LSKRGRSGCGRIGACAGPIRRVTFRLRQGFGGQVAIERRDGVKPVAVFRFLSEDWSPWIALTHMRERWPELSFKLIPSYLHTA